MASNTTPTDENNKDKSLESNCLETEKNVLCDINNLNKRDSHNDRFAFYKKPIKKYNQKLEIDFIETPQEIRRQRILHYQKKNRDALVDVQRGILKNVLNPENEEEMEEVVDEEEQEGMEVDTVKKKYRVRKEYAHMIMLSEWMLEVPQDFTDNWIITSCPVGKRVIVVACQGATKMYSRRGVQLSSFVSVLPGGSYSSSRNNFTILDCIWVKDKQTIYALDVMAWSNQEMMNCEAEFRFYWLRSQLNDLINVREQEENSNDYRISVLPYENCNKDICEYLQSVSQLFEIDGLLFYHKEAHYTSGRTPLVMWLKPYMLPEVLGVNVPEPYEEKPSSYIDFEHHVLNVMQSEKKKAEHRPKNKRWNQVVEEEEME